MPPAPLSARDDFAEMLEYDRWANRRVVRKLSSLDLEEKDHEEPVRIYSHILRSSDVWVARIRGEDAPVDSLWTPYPIGQLAEETERVARVWRMLLDEHAGELRRSVTYRNSRGDRYTNEVRTILRHVLNHGTYHRGQVALLLSRKTGDPPVTDYIAKAREDGG